MKAVTVIAAQERDFFDFVRTASEDQLGRELQMLEEEHRRASRCGRVRTHSTDFLQERINRIRTEVGCYS